MSREEERRACRMATAEWRIDRHGASDVVRAVRKCGASPKRLFGQSIRLMPYFGQHQPGAKSRLEGPSGALGRCSGIK